MKPHFSWFNPSFSSFSCCCFQGFNSTLLFGIILLYMYYLVKSCSLVLQSAQIDSFKSMILKTMLLRRSEQPTASPTTVRSAVSAVPPPTDTVGPAVPAAVSAQTVQPQATLLESSLFITFTHTYIYMYIAIYNIYITFYNYNIYICIYILCMYVYV